MEASNSPPASSDSQTKKRKGRNSDIRKEQNRIASRAYREKRRQKLALLDEILRSDSHNDSMSSVSDETEYKSTTPAPEFRATRHSSNSPAPYYMSVAPALTSVPAGIHSLPSNGPNRNTEAYANYSVKDYSGQDAERLSSQHAGYADDSSIPTFGLSSGYASSVPAVGPMPSTPMFPFDDDFMGESFGTYPPPPDSNMSSIPVISGYDPNMINALHSLSRLNDTQQQQIVAYLQKRRSGMQPTSAGDPFHLGYGGYHVPVPRPNQTSGHLQHSADDIQQSKRYPGRYASKSHR